MAVRKSSAKPRQFNAGIWCSGAQFCNDKFVFDNMDSDHRVGMTPGNGFNIFFSSLISLVTRLQICGSFPLSKSNMVTEVKWLNERDAYLIGGVKG